MSSKCRLSWRPIHLATAQNMDVQVVHRLTTVFAVIDYDAIAFLKPFFLGNLLRSVHQVTENALLVLTCMLQLGKAVAEFWDNQYVSRSLGVDVPESQALVVLMNDISWDFLCDDLVEDGGASIVRSRRCR